MDTMEITKIAGGIIGGLLIYLGVQFFTEQIFSHGGHGDEHDYAYAVELDEGGDGGEEAEEIDVATLIEEADPAKGERVFGKCKACHKLDGSNGTGPHLDGVVGRAIDGVDGFKYSGALAETGETEWTPENLFAFLEKPKSWAPGTTMGFAGLKKPADRAALIAYLQGAE